MLVSVVIPYYDSFFELNNTLKALNRQTYREFEVIVINDGSKDIKKQLPVVNFNLLYIYLERTELSGRAYARNKGILEAKGDLIIFLDCDQITNLDFIEQHVKFHKYADKENILQFGTRKALLRKITMEVELEECPFYKDERIKIFEDCNYNTSSIKGIWALVYSHNMSVLKEVLIKYGGFDEDFKGWGLEDVEMAYRFKKNGIKIMFNPFIETYDQYQQSDTSQQKICEEWIYNYNVFLNKYRNIEVKLLDIFINYFNSNNKEMLNNSGVQYTWLWCFYMFEKMLQEIELKDKYIFPPRYIKNNEKEIIDEETYFYMQYI